MIASTTTNLMAEQLAQCGFKPEGNQRYRRGRLHLNIGQGWATFQRACRKSEVDPLAGPLGKPGPWRLAGDRGGLRHLAELPASVLCPRSHAAALDDEESPLQLAVGWALAAANEQLCSEWEPPEEAEVHNWLGATKLTFGERPQLRQGSLVCQPGRLAIRVPIIGEIPPELSAARMAWLREVLIETQNRFRMVRIGMTGTEQPANSVVAEVDFSGAPEPVLEPLLVAGVSALRSAVAWSIQSAGFLADDRMSSAALEAYPDPSTWSLAKED